MSQAILNPVVSVFSEWQNTLVPTVLYQDAWLEVHGKTVPKAAVGGDLTFAALHFDGSTQVEYISAGHVPLLHSRQRQEDVIRHAMPQFPLGMSAGADYVSQRIPYRCTAEESDREESSEKDADAETPRTREATWRKLLDELSVELTRE